MGVALAKGVELAAGWVAAAGDGVLASKLEGGADEQAVSQMPNRRHTIHGKL